MSTDAPAELLDEPPSGIWDRIATSVERQDVAGPTPHVTARRSWLLSAAAVVLVVALIAAGILARTADPPPDVIARATLEPIGSTGSGSAELVDADGALQLQLATSDVDAADGFLEVWLIDPSVERLVSLGPLRPDGRYDLPAGLDAEAFPIVDVSAEPIDGDPTHSGDSRLRGTLEF